MRCREPCSASPARTGLENRRSIKIVGGAVRADSGTIALDGTIDRPARYQRGAGARYRQRLPGADAGPRPQRRAQPVPDRCAVDAVAAPSTAARFVGRRSACCSATTSPSIREPGSATCRSASSSRSRSSVRLSAIRAFWCSTKRHRRSAPAKSPGWRGWSPRLRRREGDRPLHLAPLGRSHPFLRSRRHSAERRAGRGRRRRRPLGG